MLSLRRGPALLALLVLGLAPAGPVLAPLAAQEGGEEEPAPEEPEAQEEEDPAAEPEVPPADDGEAQGEEEPAGAEEAEGSAPAEPPEPERGPALHGSSITRYRGRFTGSEDDHDVSESLVLDFGDPERHGFTFHGSGYASYDLDGRGAPDDDFFHTTDTYDQRLYGRLYEAYVDVHRTPGLATVRLGRQMSWDTPELVWFDGATVETVELGRRRVSFGAYGGLPVHFYESSASGDALFGLWLETRPFETTRARLDWLHAEDENAFGDHENDLYGLEVWQDLGERVSTWGSYTRLDDEDRDWQLRTTYSDVERAFTAQVSWYQLLETQRDLALELDPFFDSLLEYFPFWSVRALLAKDFDRTLAVQGGADIREVSDEDDVGEFNRDYQRYWLTTSLRELQVEGLEVDLTGERWDGDGTEIWTWGLDVEQELSERWDTGVGTYYSLYKFDYQLDEERDDVRTWFLRLEYRPRESTRLEMRYDFEHDDFDDYHAVRIAVTQRF